MIEVPMKRKNRREERLNGDAICIFPLKLSNTEDNIVQNPKHIIQPTSKLQTLSFYLSRSEKSLQLHCLSNTTAHQQA